MSLVLSKELDSVNTTPYKLIWYDEVVQRTQELQKSPHLFKVEDMFEKYPDITTVYCDGKPCISPLIEMTNFENGPDYIKNLPTILIVAGIHGNEVVGTNATYRFFDIVTKFKSQDDTIFSILNNLRILFLPMVNPTGYFHKRREEGYGETGSNDLTDPNRDFNWDKENSCFKTTAGQMINHVFKDNLILGSLTYHGGDNSVTYPWGTFVHENHPKSNDNEAFKQVSHMLMSAAGGNQEWHIDNFKTGTMESIVYDVNGGYEDWAYGGSYQQKFLTMNCLPKGSKYSKDFLMTDENSNRVFIFLVEAGLQKTPSEGTLGNQLSVFNKSDDMATIGNISRSVTLMKQFFEVMRPFPFVKEMKIDQKTKSMEIILDVKGCQNVDSVQVVSPPTSAFDMKVQNKSYSENTQSNLVKLEMSFPNFEELSKSPFNLELNIQCDSAWLEMNKGNGDPQSHFFRAKTNPKYHVTRKEFSLGAINLDQVIIKNLDLLQLDKAVSFHKKFNEVELLYDDHLLIHFGDSTPLKITFDNISHQTSLQVNGIEMDVDVTVTKGADRNLHEITQTILDNKDSIKVSMFQDSDYLEVSSTPSLLIEQYQNLYKPVSKKETRKLVLDNSIDQVDLNLKIGQQISLSPSAFLDLLGKRVLIEFSSDSKIPSMQGTVILPEVASITKTDELNPSAISQNVNSDINNQKKKNKGSSTLNKDKPDEGYKGLMVPTSGASCSSKSLFSLMSLPKKDDYFRMDIFPSKDDPELLNFVFQTNNTISDKEVLYFNKNFKVSLKQGKSIKANSNVYTGSSPRSQHRIIGSKIRIVGSQLSQIIFECFPEKSNSESKATTLSKIVKELFQSTQKKNPTHMEYTVKEQSAPLFWRIAMVLMIFSGIGLLICLYSAFKKKQSREEIMELPENHIVMDA